MLPSIPKFNKLVFNSIIIPGTSAPQQFDLYLQPDGSSVYFQPDGSSFYLQP